MSIDPVSLGITLALSAANMALTATRVIEGPRLDSTKFTGGDYGAPLPMMWGTRRLECPVFWAEELREVKRRRKTKGGKFNDYSYFGTWAVALAGHEISGVTRIWFDTHLVLDVTGAGPVTPFDFGDGLGEFKRNVVSVLTTGAKYDTQIGSIYTGTETQEPDPRMQATVEAQFGEGSCPAYRGTAYIVFKDVPLEKLGNRIPQVSVEMVSTSTPAYPWETFATEISQPSRLWGATFSTDYSRFMWGTFGNFEVWDVAARARMISGTFTAPIDNVQATFGIYANGDILAIGNQVPPFPENQKIYRIAGDGSSYTQIADLGDTLMAEAVRVIADGDGTEHWFTVPVSLRDVFFVDGEEWDMNLIVGTGWTPTGYFADLDGNIWAVGREQGPGVTTAYFYRVVTVNATGPNYLLATGLAAQSSSLYDCNACVAPNGQFVLAWDYGIGGHLYAVDPQTGTVTNSLAITLDPYNADKQIINLRPGAATIWIDEQEVDLNSLTVLRTIDVTDWKVEDASGIIFDPINNALICAPQFTQVLTWRYLDRLSGDGVTLGAICGQVADWVGAEDHDFSALDQLIKGWSATRGQASQIVAPLLDAFDSDVRLHDFALQGVKRSGVSGGTIDVAWFAKQDPRYTVTLRQAAELPRALLVNFADVDADQQPNTARADRPLDATGARGEQQIDLGTWATDATEARNIADRYFRRVWNERRGLTLSLTAQQLALEPGDCRTLDLDGEADTYRLISLTIKADGVLDTEWRLDHPSLAVLDGASGALFDGRTDSTITVALISKAFVLDVPLLSDADDAVTPVVYALAAPYADGAWPGAVIYQQVDGEYSTELTSVPTASPATWGVVAEELPYSNPNLWDRLSSLTVTLQRGDLTGATEAALNANPKLNLAAIGANGRWELVQFTTATLVSGKTYTVSGFKRGRRGTEWAAELHAAGDLFVLLDVATAESLGLSDVGTDQSFKAVTNGRTESGAFATTIEPFTGASLKPYAPCRLTATQDGSDWDLAWVRRTRVGGAWTGGSSIPLGETAEEYELEIMDGTTVKRTITGLTSPAYTYLAADQTTDFGAPLSAAPSFRVYQISAAVDRGFAATS